MKTLRLLFFAFLCLILATACKKHNSHPTDSNGLPPATQTGANTLGFLLNGEAWIPAGNNGSPRITYNYDPFYKNGVIGISAYRILSDTDEEYFGMGVSDSMNFTNAPKTFLLTHTGLYNFRISVANKYGLYSTDDTTYCSGSMSYPSITIKGFVILLPAALSTLLYSTKAVPPASIPGLALKV